MSRVKATGAAVLPDAVATTAGEVVAAFASAGVAAGFCEGPNELASAITAQLVAAAEIQPSLPWGKPLSIGGWKGCARLRTCQVPSASCVRSRNSTPRRSVGSPDGMRPPSINA